MIRCPGTRSQVEFLLNLLSGEVPKEIRVVLDQALDVLCTCKFPGCPAIPLREIVERHGLQAFAVGTGRLRDEFRPGTLHCVDVGLGDLQIRHDLSSALPVELVGLIDHEPASTGAAELLSNIAPYVLDRPGGRDFLRSLILGGAQ